MNDIKPEIPFETSGLNDNQIQKKITEHLVNEKNIPRTSTEYSKQFEKIYNLVRLHHKIDTSQLPDNQKKEVSQLADKKFMINELENIFPDTGIDFSDVPLGTVKKFIEAINSDMTEEAKNGAKNKFLEQVSYLAREKF